MYAILFDREDIAMYIANNGADVNVVALNGQTTALNLAIKNSMFALSTLLINYGANVSIIDENGNNAFMLACIRRGMNTTASNIWTKFDLSQINITNWNLDSPLILACSAQLDTIALQMITCGANYMHKNNDGISALDYATMYNLDNVVRFINNKKNLDDDQQHVLLESVVPSAPPINYDTYYSTDTTYYAE
jgi:ankyrin repeat protein